MPCDIFAASGEIFGGSFILCQNFEELVLEQEN